MVFSSISPASGAARPRFAMKRIRDQSVEVVTRQRRKHDVMHDRSGLAHRLELAHQRMSGRHFVVAIGADQQQILHVRMRQQILHQIQRGRVEPLQIVEKEGEGMLTA